MNFGENLKRYTSNLGQKPWSQALGIAAVLGVVCIYIVAFHLFFAVVMYSYQSGGVIRIVLDIH